MIKIVYVCERNSFKSVEITGHSGYAEKGVDIVCAGVSAVSEGSVNALERLTGKKPVYEMRDGYLKINYEQDERSQLAAQVTYFQLKTLEESYPKNIKIIEK